MDRLQLQQWRVVPDDALTDGASQGDDVASSEGGPHASTLDGTLADGSATRRHRERCPTPFRSTSGTDAAPTDAGSSSGDAFDGASPEAGPVARLLVPETTFGVEGITSDGCVVY